MRKGITRLALIIAAAITLCPADTGAQDEMGQGLLRGLESGDPVTRQLSARGLAGLPVAPLGAHHALVGLLHDPVHLVRLEAVEALGLIRPYREFTVRHLLGLFEDAPAAICSAAAVSLSRMGRDAARLVRDYRDSSTDPDVRYFCGLALGAPRKAPRPLPDPGEALREIQDREAGGTPRSPWPPEEVHERYAELVLGLYAHTERYFASQEVRRLAASELRGIQGALPHLLRPLERGPPVDDLPGLALTQISGAHEFVIPALIEVLENPEPGPRERPEWLRVHAAYALARYGPAAADAVPILRRICEDADVHLQRECRRAIDRIVPPKRAPDPAPDPTGQPIPSLIQDLESGVEKRSLRACVRLARRGEEASSALPALRAAARDLNPSVCAWSLYAIARLTGEVEPLWDQFWSSVRLRGQGIRETNLLVLRLLGEDAEPLLDELVASVREGRIRRTFFLDCVREIGVPREDVLGTLRRLRDVSFGGAADEIAEVAHILSKDDQGLLDHLNARMRQSKARSAIELLPRLGPKAVPLVPAILGMHERGKRLWLLAHALRNIGPAATPELGAALRGEDANLRLLAAYVLIRYGEEAASAADDLLAALDDPLPSVRAEAAFALACVAPGDERAPDALSDLLYDPSFEVRATAARALAKLVHGARMTARLLCSSWFDPHPFARRCAVFALRKLHGD